MSTAGKRMIDVLVLEASDAKQLWRIESIDGDDYRELNRLVKGNLGSFSLPPSMRQLGYYPYCDDDAMIRADPPAPNGWAVHLGQAQLRGPVVIVKADETGTEQSLDDADILIWTDYLMGPPTAEARQMAERSAAWWAAHPAGMAIGTVDDVAEYSKDVLHWLGLDD